jgi:hypothetical protein
MSNELRTERIQTTTREKVLMKSRPVRESGGGGSKTRTKTSSQRDVGSAAVSMREKEQAEGESMYDKINVGEDKY